MRSRQEIKAVAKQAIKNQLGICVLIMLIYAGISCVSSFAALFVVPVMSVGLAYTFLLVYTGQKAEAASLFNGFHKYGRNLGSMLLVMLFTWLWSLLFVVPGIIKALSYSMTPYILADCDNIGARDAIRLSMRITKGHKGKIFMMQLSFIGWMLLGYVPMMLGAVVMGATGISAFGVMLYVVGILASVALVALLVAPYMQASMAGLYLELKQEGVNAGAASADEFA